MQDLLKKIGFDDKESQIYNTCLQTELNTPTGISKQTNIKRSTVYFYLDKLKDKGLLKIVIKGKHKYYVIRKPELAFTELSKDKEKELKQLKEIIKKVSSKFQESKKQKSDSTKIQYYEGPKEIKMIVRKLIEKNDDIYWFGSAETQFSILPKEEIYRLLTLPRMKKYTTAYSITDKKILQHKKFTEEIDKFRKFRFLDKNIDIPAMLVMSGDLTVLATKENNLVKIMSLEDEIMTELILYMFKMLWDKLDEVTY